MRLVKRALIGAFPVQKRTVWRAVITVRSPPFMGENRPHSGDVVVQWQMRSPAVYVLRKQDGRAQGSYKTYEEALARAIGCARREHLDAWYTNDGQVFERLSQHRSTAG